MLHSAILHLRILVSGTVQGVWYRKGTCETAHGLHISGHVENLPDGRVLIEAEGSPAALDALVEWCRTGPSGAKVLSVYTEERPLEGFTNFEILR